MATRSAQPRSHRRPAEQRQDQQSRGERIRQADAEGHLGDALQRELQAEHPRPARRGRVVRQDDFRYPLGVKRHVDCRTGRRPRAQAAASRQRFSIKARPPIARIIGSASSRIISAAPPAMTAGHQRSGPMDGDHQRQQQRRPAFVEQAGHRLQHAAEPAGDQDHDSWPARAAEGAAAASSTRPASAPRRAARRPRSSSARRRWHRAVAWVGRRKVKKGFSG